MRQITHPSCRDEMKHTLHHMWDRNLLIFNNSTRGCMLKFNKGIVSNQKWPISECLNQSIRLLIDKSIVHIWVGRGRSCNHVRCYFECNWPQEVLKTEIP